MLPVGHQIWGDVSLGPSITVNNADFQNAVVAYLNSAEGRNTLKEFGLPTWILIGACGFQVVTGMLLLVTIYRSLQGIRNIYEGVTLRPFREEKAKNRQLIAELKPLICHGIYGNAQTGLGVVLGSFSQETDQSNLASTARELTSLYGNGSAEPQKQSMLRILKDDRYSPYRRRRLAAPYRVDDRSFLFDVSINFRDGATTPIQTVMHAFVAMDESDGEISQIPWAVARPFVTIGEPRRM